MNTDSTAASAGLEASSEDQPARRKAVPARYRNRPGFEPVQDVPGLPRVLLIGDSISIGYTTGVRKRLVGVANVHRVPDNAATTAHGLAHLDSWLGVEPWDLIHFNWGLHDLKRMRDGRLDLAGDRVISTDQYRANLEQLVRRLADTRAVLVWATTTPVPEGAAGRKPADEIVLNRIAAEIMDARDIAIDDLHALVLPRLTELQRPADVHFTAAGYEVLADRVAAVVREQIQGTQP